MTTAQRHIIRWDRDAHEWVVWSGLTRVGAFDKCWQAEVWVCGDAVLDLDEPAEVDR